ncbi:MAG: nucleotide sugar dehydrogenase [Tannerellaceae bacterium]|jgi:UDP-N-acetyl-D-galactosamine dehydrogenase|nr:nucleotide sugar dehydrogenase [Tannerellaceae bacterium]
MGIYSDLLDKKHPLAVIGLGYVGLPLALALAGRLRVIGFDTNPLRIADLQQGVDRSGELEEGLLHQALNGQRDISFTSDCQALSQASFFIIAVPTPVDPYNQPQLDHLRHASALVGAGLTAGDYVVFESTVFPGCTEEECLPILEKESGLRAGRGFKYGYSPERINPGDKEHTLTNTVKIISACDHKALHTLHKVYSLVVQAPLYHAPSIRVAEAAKIIENTQRDVNIALINELSIVLGRMGINTYDVLQAAATKWNFTPFSPGLVGGHCVGVDPYYLVYKAHELNYHPRIIHAGRVVNDAMGAYIGKKVAKRIVALGKALSHARVLVLGITFKENVADIRNSKVVDIIRELTDFGLSVDVADPYASPQEVQRVYKLSLIEPQAGAQVYDAIILAVPHQPYLSLHESDFLALAPAPAIFADLKGLFRSRIHSLEYWSL